MNLRKEGWLGVIPKPRFLTQDSLQALFNNCHNRPHTALFGRDAFFDLGTFGKQGTQANSLPPGQTCVVLAKASDNRLNFEWYSFLHERPDPADAQNRVLCGEFFASDTLKKRTAFRNVRYRAFFKKTGEIKNGSVCRGVLPRSAVPTPNGVQEGHKFTTGGKDLPLKDEADLVSIQEARTIASKRLHNHLTNKLKKQLCNFKLLEGSNQNALFDVLVADFDGRRADLLIEAKSSVEIAHIRMAVGQLFDYWFNLHGSKGKRHLAILLPEKPAQPTIRMLDWLAIGVLWFEGKRLETNTAWLKRLVHEA